MLGQNLAFRGKILPRHKNSTISCRAVQLVGLCKCTNCQKATEGNSASDCSISNLLENIKEYQNKKILRNKNESISEA
jgi:hypothetical protein